MLEWLFHIGFWGCLCNGDNKQNSSSPKSPETWLSLVFRCQTAWSRLMAQQRGCPAWHCGEKPWSEGFVLACCLISLFHFLIPRTCHAYHPRFQHELKLARVKRCAVWASIAARGIKPQQRVYRMWVPFEFQLLHL